MESVRRVLESMGFSASLIDSLEEMRLASIGAPDVREPVPTFTLTGVGRLVRQAILSMPLPELGYAIDPAVTSAVLKLARGELLTPEESELLASRGLAHAGRLTWPGRYLRAALDKLRRPRGEQSLIGITAEEVKLLLSIKELWKKHEANPEIVTSKDRIVKQVAEDWGIEAYDPTSALYTLEALDIIYAETAENGKLAYWLTEWGRDLLEAIGREPRDLSSTAVKAVLYALGERAPSRW